METFSRYWSFVWGNHRSSVVSRTQRPVTRSFDVFSDVPPEQTTEQTVQMLVIWDAIALIMTSL